MKLLIILLMLLNVANGSELLLKFDTEEHKQEWIEWYLDRDGEVESGFYATDWTKEYFNLVPDVKTWASVYDEKFVGRY